ncbi:MAG: DUF1592 domain-containing protein [Planctomycetaceae bacterium]
MPALALLCTLFVTPGLALDGAAIYRQKCASCHGAEGEGVADAYEQPLIGDRSVQELARMIHETMPEGEPEQCVGAEAEAVAAYIHETFYSEIAQYRKQPARLEFARLTVRQYEQTVADLIGSFNPLGDWPVEPGLQVSCYDSRNFDRKGLAYERTDPTVDFDYGEGSPDPKKDKEEEFSLRWEGGLIAPETGIYTFIVETENGARLWVNDTERPLIDAAVRSGPETRFTGELRLLAGRIYPLKLEYFKFKEKTASIRLKWIAPHHVEEVVPQRQLRAGRVGETFVLKTQFPPDDRSTGFERGTSVSPEWNDATTMAAIEVAGYVEDRIVRLAKTRPDADDRPAKLKTFCELFAERAFRKPLSDAERELYVERQFNDATDADTAVKRVVLLVLKSPRFLYREIGWPEFGAFEVASWLSYTLWDSIPDKPLWDAARQGRLKTREQIRSQVDRMVGDPRTRAKVREFFLQWLKVDRFDEIAKDTSLFPEFDDAMIADLRTSLDLFIEQTVWSERSDFRQLFLANDIPVNRRMAAFYGVDIGDDPQFAPVSLEPDRRSGVLSHPYLLAGFAYDDITSPIHRGVFLARNVLGRVLNPPPIAVAPLAPEVHPDLTTRERVIVQTSPAMCVKCHNMINSLGFPLEEFDAVGRFREIEKGQPIDATGSYVTRDGEEVRFTGVRELASFLVDSPEAQSAFAEKLFQYLTKQPVRAFGTDSRDELCKTFEAGDFQYSRLDRRVDDRLGGTGADNAVPAGRVSGDPTAPRLGDRSRRRKFGSILID